MRRFYIPKKVQGKSFDVFVLNCISNTIAYYIVSQLVALIIITDSQEDYGLNSSASN